VVLVVVCVDQNASGPDADQRWPLSLVRIIEHVRRWAYADEAWKFLGREGSPCDRELLEAREMKLGL
jgi:hypothetical protein